MCLLLATPARALVVGPGDSKCEDCSKCSQPGEKFTLVFDLSRDSSSGNKVRGQARIKFINANVLRYDIQIGTKVTWSAGPKIDLSFIPKLSEPPAKPAQAEAAAKAAVAKAAAGAKAATAANEPPAKSQAPKPLDKAWEKILISWDERENELGEVRGKISDVTTAVNDTSSKTLGLVATSDATLQTGGAQQVANSAKELVGEIDKATKAAWPDEDVNKLATELTLLTNQLIEFPFVDPLDLPRWQSINGRMYDQVKARLETLTNLVQGLTRDGEQGRKFAEAKDSLSRWRLILDGIGARGAGAFCIVYSVGCSFAFDGNKENLITVVKRDRLSVNKPVDKNVAATPTGTEGSVEIVTVVCSSPLSVSAGFGFSTIDEKEFVFVQSTKTAVDANGVTTQKVINLFGFKNNSAFRTLPVLLLNTRLWEPSDRFAIHASAGAAVDVKTGQAGTDIEYIVGGSLSFWRSLFVTPALHIGRVPTLVGGFTLGQQVPDGIKEPPVEKAWKKGFAVTFTYKLR